MDSTDQNQDPANSHPKDHHKKLLIVFFFVFLAALILAATYWLALNSTAPAVQIDY
jgi:hypothetical protein